MKIVNLLGGLGNQMFQYAFFLSLREKCKDEVVIVDKSCFRGYPLHNGFELERIFHVDCRYASWRDILKVAYPYPNYRFWQVGKYLLPKRRTMWVESKDMALDLAALDVSDNCYYDGYWQHDEYFREYRDVILNAFSFPALEGDKNKKAQKLAMQANSVSVHVRRGDYLNNAYFKGICDFDYYERAIRYMVDKVKTEVFFVFSNDVGWCEENLNKVFGNSQVVYVDWNKGKDSFIDMQLMSCCKHNIIANSSFSWWGAWLNKNEKKVVVAPQKWMNVNLAADPICKDWVRI